MRVVLLIKMFFCKFRWNDGKKKGKKKEKEKPPAMKARNKERKGEKQRRSKNGREGVGTKKIAV